MTTAKKPKVKARSVRPRPGKSRPGKSQAQAAPAPEDKPMPGATPAGAGLGNIRESIDAIDARIHALLNERARFAQLVGISKSSSGKAVDYYRPEREAEVLRLALKRNQGPLRDEGASHHYLPPATFVEVDRGLMTPNPRRLCKGSPCRHRLAGATIEGMSDSTKVTTLRAPPPPGASDGSVEVRSSIRARS